MEPIRRVEMWLPDGEAHTLVASQIERIRPAIVLADVMRHRRITGAPPAPG